VIDLDELERVALANDFRRYGGVTWRYWNIRAALDRLAAYRAKWGK
jgi:hypothetical protein